MEAVGLGPLSLDDVAPSGSQARWLQYHWTLPLSDDPASRAAVVDVGDGTEYTAAHADHHAFLTDVMAASSASDLLLVTAAGDVVYSVNKAVDFGTDLVDGPLRDSELAATVLDDLTRVRVGSGVIADFEIYVPGGGQPTMFVTAAVRDDTEVVGALALQIPIAALNAITAADGTWDEVGLRGGESYVVGGDEILRSESRRWIEDPDGYLDAVDDDELAALIGLFDSPVGLQPVETEPVAEALDGRVYAGDARNYLGQRTFSHATPIDVVGVDWVVVTDVPLSEARQPLVDFVIRLGIVLLIVLPAAAIGGILLANRLTRPIPPVVDAAAAIADGDRDPDIPDLGNDEFGDLARRLRGMAAELGRREASIVEEYEQTRELLLTVLPPRLVDGDGNVVGAGETLDDATVVAMWLEVQQVADSEALADFLALASTATEAMADRYAVERIRAAADHSLFLAGIGTDDDGADTATRFAEEFVVEIGRLAEEHEVEVALHCGLSTGRVATGMLERGHLTFAAWGSPVRRALAIGALGEREAVLLDATTAQALRDDRALSPAGQRISLDGEPIELFALG